MIMWQWFDPRAGNFLQRKFAKIFKDFGRGMAREG
jgi:hypothetical protein